MKAREKALSEKKFRSVVVLVLGTIFLLGLLLRLYRLPLNIPSLYGDEVGGGYSSWVTLRTPKDLVVNIPLALASYTWLLGLTPLAVRLPSAVYGSLVILALFFLGLALSKDLRLAVLTAALGVVVPWSFMLGRIGFAYIPLLVIFVCLQVIMYMKSKSFRDYVLSIIPLLLAAFLYPSAIVAGGFVLILVGWQMLKVVGRGDRWLTVIAISGSAVVVIFLLFWKYHGFSLQSRGIDLAIWRDVNVTADSNLYRGLARLSEPTIFSFGKPTEALGNKIVYNYPGSILGVFFRNYLSFFSPDFLFLKGDTTLRQSTGMTGSFFLVMLPFMVYGLYLLLTRADRKVRDVVLLWILVSPIPGAITKDGPGYLLRVVTVMPFLTYLSAWGIVQFLRNFRPKLRLAAGAIVGVMLLYSAYSFLYGYFQVYPALAARNYEFGFKELSDFQFSHGGVPMLVIWDGYYPNLYFRFWQKTPAGEYLAFRQEDLSYGGSTFHKMFPNLYFSLPRTEKDLAGFLSEAGIPYWAVSADFLKKNPEYRLPEKSVAQIVKYPDGTDDFVIYKGF